MAARNMAALTLYVAGNELDRVRGKTFLLNSV